ncbi:MAG: Dabb family protein [Rhodospirillaceae bacterium]|nr:Dabb family protein [Rhodospirillaceae bacterium]
MMHRHTVLFNLKDELPEAEKKRIIDSMQTLKTISVVKGYMLEKNKLPLSEKAPFEWLLIADFANDDDRQVYEKDAHHVKVIKGDFVPNVKNYMVSDVNF